MIANSAVDAETIATVQLPRGGDFVGKTLLLGNDTKGCLHCVLPAWCENYGGAENIAGFDARKGLPFVVPEIGDQSRTFLAGIPDDGGSRVFFFGSEYSTPCRIDQLRSAVDIDVGVVRPGGKDQVPGLGFCAVAIEVIEILDSIETANADVLCVADAEIRMQCLFETKGGRSGIGND